MNVRPWRIGSVVLLAAIACGSSSAAAIVSREAGDRLQFKLEAMTQGGASHPPSRRMTTITEGELNSYLAFNAKEKIPRGLSQPDIRMLDRGQLTGSVFVDIDEYKRVNPPKGFTDPLTYVFGRVPVTARGTLRSYAGRGQFQLASAEIMGLPLPKPVFRQMVSFFTRTPESPFGFNIDAPFVLPARIRGVTVNRAEAVIDP
jgi:hypothetical protein